MAVITATPMAFAVTLPVVSTEATAGLPLNHSTLLSVALEGVMVGFKL